MLRVHYPVSLGLDDVVTTAVGARGELVDVKTWPVTTPTRSMEFLLRDPMDRDVVEAALVALRPDTRPDSWLVFRLQIHGGTVTERIRRWWTKDNDPNAVTSADFVRHWLRVGGFTLLTLVTVVAVAGLVLGVQWLAGS